MNGSPDLSRQSLCFKHWITDYVLTHGELSLKINLWIKLAFDRSPIKDVRRYEKAWQVTNCFYLTSRAWMIKKVNEVSIIPKQRIVCFRVPDQTVVRSWKHIRKRITHFLLVEESRVKIDPISLPNPRPKTSAPLFFLLQSRQCMTCSICAPLRWITWFLSYIKRSH